MPLTFVLGLPGSGKTSYCLREILERLFEREPAPALFYIVPEQFSLQAERLLVEGVSNMRPSSPGAKGAVIRAQALSFGRLAYYVFARAGGAPVKQLTDTGKNMLLRKIIQECGGDLTFYARAARKQGFIESLAVLFTEFSQYAVSPYDLETRAKRALSGEIRDESAGLSAKLSDLSVLYRRYREHISGRYLVTGETLDLLADSMSAGNYLPLLQNGLFWIDGFTGFTPQERRVLSHIIRVAGHVTVTLTMDNPPEEGRDIRISDFFLPTKRTMRLVKAIAEGVRAEICPDIILPPPYRGYPEQAMSAEKKKYTFHPPCGFKHNDSHMLSILTRHFPAPRPVQEQIKAGDIRIIAAPDKPGELLYTAGWIAHNTRETGLYRYKDIAVLCGDLPGYEKWVRNIFSNFRIPVFLDCKQGILSHPLTECIRSALEISTHDWQYEGVFRLLKTGMTPLEADDIDRLENYVLARGIKSWKWRNPWREPEFEEIRLRVLEILGILEPLRNEKKLTVTEMSRLIFDWLYTMNIPGKLADMAENAFSEEASRIHRQIWPCICEIFDKLSEILGGEALAVHEFSEIIDAGFKNADLGIIPPTLDEVVIGNINRSRYPDIKVLFVLGANEGLLPPPAQDNGLLTEDERKTLESTGLELAPDVPRQASEGLLSLYGALCRPREKLLILYSRASADGKTLRPSSVIARFKKIFPSLTEYEIPAVYNNSFENEEAAPFPLLSEKSTKALYGNSFVTAASRLEAYINCPFAYFLAYGVHARERRIYRVQAFELGILYHDVIKNITNLLTEQNLWATATRSDISAWVREYAEFAAGDASDNPILRSSARNEYVLQRVKNVCEASVWALCEQYKRGEFKIMGTEKDFNIILPLQSAQPTHMTITGRVDRVDIYAGDSARDGKFAQYLKIIDYKSGNTRFDPNEALYGTQIQLPLYMNALLKDSPSLPGGMFYFNMDDPILPADAPLDPEEREAALLKYFRLSGLALADLASVYAMDKQLSVKGGDSIIIPVGINQNGSYRKNASVALAEEFDSFCKSVEDRVKKIGRRISGGYIPPRPHTSTRSGRVTSACDYCRFSAVCGFNKPN